MTTSESKGRFFYKTNRFESIRITNRIESIRIANWDALRRRLRSASTEQLDVPTCRRSTIGGRAFPVAGAKVWNGLPSEVTSASSLSVFKNRLKTYFFRRCYETVWLSITFPFPSHYLPPQNSGPCNSFYCLGHFKKCLWWWWWWQIGLQTDLVNRHVHVC